MVMHQSTEEGGNQVRSQQVRRIRRGLAVWCLGCAIIMAGCSGDGDNSTPIPQPIQSIAPKDVTVAVNLIPGVENKSYRFSDGSVFGIQHFDAQGKVVPVAVTLTFGDFGGTVSAPFALVSS